MKRTLKFLALAALATTALVTRSFAVAYDFSNGNGTNNWVDGLNWSPAGGPPTATDNGRVGTTAFPTETANLSGTDAGTAMTAIIGFDSGTNGTLNASNNSTLTVNNNFTVGGAGTGTANLFNKAAITVTNDVRVGSAAGNGTLNLNNQSTLSVGNGFVVGGANIGMANLLNNSNVTVHGTFMHIGETAGSNGTVIMRNNAILNMDNPATADLFVGDGGTGTLEIHGNAIVGTNSATDPITTVIARQAGSFGTVLVDGGTLNTFATIDVGGALGVVGGTGLLKIVNGGTVTTMTSDVTVWGTNSDGNRSELAVDSTYTLNVGGALNFNGNTLRMIGDGVDFINDATLNNLPGPDLNGVHVIVSDGNTATIDGLFQGNGHLVKEGTGTLILNNVNNTYGGGTNINNGTLVVGVGSTAGATVLGHGPVNLNNNAVLETPTDTPLLYDVYTAFNANGGTLNLNLKGPAAGVDSDEMLIFGPANLTTNSNMFAHEVPGGFFSNGDVVPVIVGTVINGTFAQGQGDLVPNDFVGLIQPFADYSTFGEVDLVFGFAATFESVAKTPNQIATAHALDLAVAANCIPVATNVLGNIPINLLRHAYDLIAPEELASIYEASFGQGMAQSLNLQHRMDDIRWGSTGFCADGFVIQDNHGYTKNDGKSVADKNPVEQVAPPNYRWGSFITGTGELTKVGAEGDNADGYQLNNASFTMGVDYRVTDHWAIGLSGGYTHTSGDLVNDGHLNTDGGRIGLYTTWGSGGFYVDASATGGWNQYDTRRTAYLGQDTGSTDGAEFDGMIAAGYDWKRGCWIFGPYADFEYSYVEFNSFSEDARIFSNTSSLIPLHYPDQNQSAYRSNLGFRIAHEQVMKPGEGLTVVPEVRAAWRHDFGDNSYAIDSNFIGCTDVFTVHGPWIGSDSAVVDIGLTAYCTQQLSAYIFYQGQFGRDNYNNNAISGGMRWAF